MMEDPAVITWRIALAPRPRHVPVGRHWWRELVVESWRAAHHAWWLQREATALGYRTEQREYDDLHPAPRLADFMVAMSTGQIAPERVS